MLGECSIVLLAAGPGDMRDALRSVLVCMPNVIIVEAADAASAEAALQTYHPDIVMIDGDLPGNQDMQLIRSIRRHKPAPCSVILANTVPQQAAALKAGAAHSPLKGEPAPRVFARVEQLLGLQKPYAAV